MRILIAEDEALSRRLLEASLRKWGFEVLSTSNGEEAWEALCAPDAPAIAILDWMMPKRTGPDICRALREQEKGKNQETYVLLLTAKTEQEDIVEGLIAGANDYVQKPFNRSELKARVEVGVRMVELQEELSRRMQELETANRKLEELSSLDGLTGIPNRRHFDLEIDREWRRSIRNNSTPVSLVMIDVDKFKNYNDNLGHVAGDECLKQVAEALKGTARRASDLVVRYGGEEFAALLAESDAEAAQVVAENLRQAVRNLELPHPDSPAGEFVTVSLGVATIRPTHDSSHVSLIEAADGALYQAKEGGRDCYCVAGEE